MGEQELQTKIIKWLFENKIYAFKVINATTSGHTDITACVEGLFIGIEVKDSLGRVTTLQEYTHKRILASGGVVFVVRPDSLEDFKNQILKLRQYIIDSAKVRKTMAEKQVESDMKLIKKINELKPKRIFKGGIKWLL